MWRQTAAETQHTETRGAARVWERSQWQLPTLKEKENNLNSHLKELEKEQTKPKLACGSK